MVHRSGSALILTPNESNRKQLLENNKGANESPQIFPDSQNLPQFIDRLDSCVESTEIQNKKSTPPSLADPSILTPGRAARSTVQNKYPTKSSKTPRKLQESHSVNDGASDRENDAKKRISPPFRIRTGLRSNSLENSVFLRSGEDGVAPTVGTPKRRGRKMRKKRKDLSSLKKSFSAENINQCNPPEEGDIDAPTTLTCSLPLDRLSGILETIYSVQSHLPVKGITTSDDTITTKSDSQGHSSQLIKLLCLYCDKKFSSQKVRSKHTERVHAITKGRRLSSRNSISCPSILSAFPGCSYCSYTSNKLKTVAISDDLKSLFHHLVDFHSERYFACKICAIRFLSADELEKHQENHKTVSGNKGRNSESVTKKTRGFSLERSASLDASKIAQSLHTDTSNSDKSSSLGDEGSIDPESTPTKTRRQLKQAMENKPLNTRSCQNMLRNDEAILSRLGVAQNRLPRVRKGIRNRRICNLDTSKNETPLSTTVKTRSKVGRVITSNITDVIESVSRPITNSRTEVLSCTFDDNFYENVSLNVRQNLSCHLDGKLEGDSTSPSPLSPVANFPTIRSTVVKSPLYVDSEIHEATALTTVTAFPTLLTAEQYGSDLGGTTKIKRPITKHSWKWKWDCVKKYKYVTEGGKIVKKIKQPIAGLRDLSKLDMWTQLTMRTKHEMCRRQQYEMSGITEISDIGETLRDDKRKQIVELNTILDARRLPQIIMEQSEQTIIKIEATEDQNPATPVATSSRQESPQLGVAEVKLPPIANSPSQSNEFPQMLNLYRKNSELTSSQEDIILSGEWARPRCYICFGCGAKFDKLKTLEEHKMFRHPHVYSTHYEIVGRELIEGDLYKHFYIPTKALHRHKEYRQRTTKKGGVEIDTSKIGFCENSTFGDESMDSVNSVPASYSTATSRSDCDIESKTVFASTSSSVTISLGVEEESVMKFHGNCTKCHRECNGILELYRHMLDCSGDYAWILAKKRKYRYFGAKKRKYARHNLPLSRRKNNKDTTVKSEDGEGSSSQKPKTNPSTPRPKPSDADSIRRMLENLPAKRLCRQIIPNVTKPRVRKIPQSIKKGILVKSKNGRKVKGKVAATTTVTAITENIRRNHNKRIYNRRLRHVRAANKKQQRCVNNISQISDKANQSEKKPNEGNATMKKDVDKTPPKEEDNEENISKKIVDKTEESVVHAIGRKTRRLVKKITQRFQPINSKKRIRKVCNEKLVENQCEKTTEEIGISSDVPDENNEEAEGDNKQTDTRSNSKVKDKVLKKGSSALLLKKLSFRKSPKIEQPSTKNSDNAEISAKKDDEGPVETAAVVVPDIKQPDTNIKTPAVESGIKISKKKGLKKILNKLRERSMKKLSIEETETNSNAAVDVEKIDINFSNSSGNDNDKEKQPADVISDKVKDIVINVIEETTKENEQTEEHLKNDQVFLSVDLQQPLNLSVPSQNLLQVSPTTKRRGKKLNDCIAMLTGKLQEKLGKPFCENAENLETALSRQSSATDVSGLQDSNASDETIDSIYKAPIDLSLSKKPPKRKTVSRKIIKKDNKISEDVANDVLDLSSKVADSMDTSIESEKSSKIILRPPVLKVASPEVALNVSSNVFKCSDNPDVQKVPKIITEETAIQNIPEKALTTLPTLSDCNDISSCTEMSKETQKDVSITDNANITTEHTLSNENVPTSLKSSSSLNTSSGKKKPVRKISKAKQRVINQNLKTLDNKDTSMNLLSNENNEYVSPTVPLKSSVSMKNTSTPLKGVSFAENLTDPKNEEIPSPKPEKPAIKKASGRKPRQSVLKARGKSVDSSMPVNSIDPIDSVKQLLVDDNDVDKLLTNEKVNSTEESVIDVSTGKAELQTIMEAVLPESETDVKRKAVGRKKRSVKTPNKDTIASLKEVTEENPTVECKENEKECFVGKIKLDDEKLEPENNALNKELPTENVFVRKSRGRQPKNKEKQISKTSTTKSSSNKKDQIETVSLEIVSDAPKLESSQISDIEVTTVVDAEKAAILEVNKLTDVGDNFSTLTPTTKKYTRQKTAKKCDAKSSIVNTASSEDKTQLNNSINLNETTATSVESVTLVSTLPRPQASLPPIENKLSTEKSSKRNKRFKKCESIKLDVGGKLKDDIKLQSFSPQNSNMAQNPYHFEEDGKDSKVTVKDLKNLRKERIKNNKASISKKEQKSNSKEGQPETGHALTEVEEIVASFLSDDDDQEKANITEQDSTDKPIRIDEAEAILREDDPSDEESRALVSADQTDHNESPATKAVCANVPNLSQNTAQNKTDLDCVNQSAENSSNGNFQNMCKEVTINLVKLSGNEAKIGTEAEEKSDCNMKAENAPLKKGRTRSQHMKQITENAELEATNGKIPAKSSHEPKLRGRRSRHSVIPQIDSSDQSPKLEVSQNTRSSKQSNKNENDHPENELKEKTPIESNIKSIDDASSCSTSKHQDSETDIRPDSAAKKQRRRRKNELAAIVADQLLESFKEVDKSKIDDLKILENLAYEKSDNLLLTGMRLTPTTKRKISPPNNKDKTKVFNLTTRNSAKTQKKVEENTKVRGRSRSQTSYKENTKNLSQGSDPELDIATKGEKLESSSKKRKQLENISQESHENLFKSLSKNNEPLKLNVEPLSNKHNCRIVSNFNTTQFEIFSTFKSSFDTFRSLNDFSFMNRKDIMHKSNFVPGSTETSNSVDSQILRQDDNVRSCDNGSGEKTKVNVRKKLKKKINRKKDKKIDNENINELRTGLELFSFGKEISKDKDICVSKSMQQTFYNSTPDLRSKTKKIDTIQFDKDSKKSILRPSILSVTLKTSHTSGSDTPSEALKAISSRDPRLNKNKIQMQNRKADSSKDVLETEKKRPCSIRLRRRSERDILSIKRDQLNLGSTLNTLISNPRDRLRSSKRLAKLPLTENTPKNPTESDGRSDEEDIYLSQIAKIVKEKIMSTDDEGDGFEMGNFQSAMLIERPTTSMSLRSMPNFNDDQSNAEFLHDDDNTNTELIDMDLEDDMSVYTSFSQDVSRFTGKGKFGNKRRRRKSILFSRKPKKQNANPDLPEEVFNCDICNKSFRKAAALSKHQMTLTHISKLSEHEYLNASKQRSADEELRQKEQEEECREKISYEPEINIVPAGDVRCPEPVELYENSEHSDETMRHLDVDDKEAESVEGLVNEGEAAAAMPVQTEVPIEPVENVVHKSPSPAPAVSILSQSGIEPISSPEQLDSNYENRYQTVSSRIALSQEERLFYECCNMLKGSETPMIERTYPIVPYSTYDVPNKPVTPKSSERFSYLGSEVSGNFHHGTAYTVKSPMSQSRTSPRHAYPKIDTNQFSDISSDSNPGFPRSQPRLNMHSNLNYPPPDLSNKPFSPYHHSSPLREVQNAPAGLPIFGQEARTHNYQGTFFSGEGSFTPTEFPVVTDGSAASLTARTFVNDDRIKDFNAVRENVNFPTYSSDLVHERTFAPTKAQNFTSPIHSTSSQGSTTTTCRMKTKAAMKGYDNFKVSIPTTGLDMQQALERSPHGGCKLTALAEIALGSEAPISHTRYPPLQMRDEINEKPKVKSDINEKFAKKYQELIKSNMKPSTQKTLKKKDAVEKTGNKLGFKAKKNKIRNTKNTDAVKSSEKLKDIYEFDDSEEMEASQMNSPIRERVSKLNEEKIVIPERPFKDIGLDEHQEIKFHKPEELSIQNEESVLSSTSYSDRDDFNYGSMTDNDDNDNDNEGSSDSESISSVRTTKTIENKCLIMGRIFKNATKNRSEEKKHEKIASEAKKKLPTQELNKLFDSLREDKEADVPATQLQNEVEPPAEEKVATISGKNIEEKEDPPCTSDNAKCEKVPFEQSLERGATMKSAKGNAVAVKDEKSHENSTAKEKKRVGRRSRKDASQEHSKEMYNLQSELGMSPEQIAELIGEGKRKSQRRCAANRSQRFVETWSSDEYEDFLSTKDIIAFIAEKEKKSRKRKSTSRNSDKKKDNTTTKSECVPETNAQNNKNKSKDVKTEQQILPKASTNEKTNKKPEKIVDKLLEKINKVQKSNIKKEEDAPKAINTSEKSDKDKKLPPNKTVESNGQKKVTLVTKTRLKSTAAESESDFETEWFKGSGTRSKIKKRRKTISFKEQVEVKPSSNMTYSGRKLPAKTKIKNNPKENTNAKATEKSEPSARPLARRKRVASEMLYYWSSSSDEEFGRIETRDDDDDITPEGEHYQQHGWIVGDSHKKLVTLLAIAKGKKVEDCGVKETGHKKKS